MPAVETGDESYRWRRAWVYELATDRVRQVCHADSNIWEAVWCGNEAIAAVVSPGPGEGLWYSARLHIIEMNWREPGGLHAPGSAGLAGGFSLRKTPGDRRSRLQ